jgi:hypothetical protein
MTTRHARVKQRRERKRPSAVPQRSLEVRAQVICTLFGLRVRDLDCVFKLFRREVLDQIQMTATGAAINAEIMVQCVRGGLRIGETPVTHYLRYHGAPTGAALKVICRAFRELPQLWRLYSEPAGSLLTRRAQTFEPASSPGTAGS